VLARGLEVQGLLNIQFAVQGDDVFVLEANPRASRTVPFISKATGVPLAKVATRVMLGETLAELRAAGVLRDGAAPIGYVAIKEPVLPWSRFPEEDTVLGPEMRSTGEVMGIGPNLGVAYAKSMLAAGHRLPADGQVFISLADRDKPLGVEVARRFVNAGYRLLATHGTAGHLARHGIAATHVDKVGEGSYDPVQLIEEGLIGLVVNTPQGKRARGDGGLIRRAATRHGIPCVTTVQGGLAMAGTLGTTDMKRAEVATLQDHHARIDHG
jgi:carbamoyl-phosphate synthase large subunit